MIKNFQEIINQAKKVALSSEEKKTIRVGLELFMAKPPVRNTSLIRHLWQERSKVNISLRPLMNKLQYMVIALIITLVLGGSVSFAAESTRPGDILYPIKVGVNEEVGDWLAISNQAQAKWDARRAERRLEEAEKLAVEGRLDAAVRAEIESRFASHAQAFQERAEKIEAKQNSGAALEINSDFEASLRAHERVLAQLASEETNNRGEAGLLLAEVRSRLNATAEARTNVEARVIAAEANAESKAAAEGKFKAAENKINEVRGFITQVKSAVSADAYVQAQAKLKVATDVVLRGKAEIEAQTYGKALASFQEAIRIAQEAKLLVATEQRIDLEIVVPTNIPAQAQAEINSEAEQDTPDDTAVEAELNVELETEVEPDDSTLIETEGKVKIDIGL